MNPTNLIKRTSVSQMSDAYRAAMILIKDGYQKLERAEKMLKESFKNSYGFDTIPNDYTRFSGNSSRAESVCLALKQAAWREIFNKINIRKLMSAKRQKELEKQLEDPKLLPEITTENIMGLLENVNGNLDTYIEEAVAEVFEMLRPRNDFYKTNTEYAIGKKVILGAFYPNKWDTSPKIGYDHKNQFRILDNVFHLLDGKGPVESYGGPLLDTISELKEFGEQSQTEYFKFRCYKNGNIHIEFKRLDLVAKLNAEAGGNRLNK